MNRSKMVGLAVLCEPPAITVGVCGSAHALIDAICAGILFSLCQRGTLPWSEAGAAFVLYNVLAFGAQPLLGWVVDWSRQPRAAALLGGALVAGAAAVFNHWPLAAIVAAGLGNALFHLGAGSICLQLTPGRATAPGLFVAPGGLGLCLGTLLGLAGKFVAWPFVLLLTGLGGVLLWLPVPATPVAQRPTAREWKWTAVVLLLLLGCVGARSLVGFCVVLPWRSVVAMAISMALAAALGKALGGVLADRFGWGRITVAALALAAPLLAFGAKATVAPIAGLFLVNLTMAVTLAAVANLLPGRPALAFGLTCLALEMGAWPLTRPGADPAAFAQPWLVFGVTVGAAVALYAALRIAFMCLPARFYRLPDTALEMPPSADTRLTMPVGRVPCPGGAAL
jgi:MFS transporter, FSR family, fosmidomycin resistance protein